MDPEYPELFLRVSDRHLLRWGPFGQKNPSHQHPKKWVGESLPWWLRDLHKGHLRREKVADFSHEKNAFSIVGLTYSYFLFKKSIETTDCLSLQTLN
jgi:hypothetical protein